MKMSDYLMRDDAPLSDEEWATLDELVVGVARKLLVGRRFIHLTGPLGMGVQAVPLPTVSGGEACLHDEEGCACEAGECGVIQVTGHRFLSLPLIHQDFRLSWRDIEASRRMGWPPELGPAGAASAACARAEDELIFHGHPEHGYQGLLNADGRHTVPLGGWDEPGQAFADIVAATEALVANGFYEPFAVILSPALYARTQRIAKGVGRLESKLIEDVAEGGLFRSPVLAENQGLVVAQGVQNLDLVVAQDLATAYLGPENMDHHFRVLESLVLRIKRAGAICTLEKKGK
jgi:uncharacterized linocin/CFP29 family protein